MGNISSLQIEVLSLDDIGYTEEIVEDGESFQENALIKAAVPASLGYIGIADDSGLTVDALGGAPGIYSARYAGENATDAINNAKLLCELRDLPAAERGAAFVSVVACVLPENLEKQIPEELRAKSRDGLQAFTVRGECRGSILREQHGEGGFGYDPLFYTEVFGKTFAELTPEEKNSISHRGIAMRAFCETFRQVFEEKN